MDEQSGESKEEKVKLLLGCIGCE